MDNVVMPKLSDMMEEGKILSWSKQVGDTVAKGDALAEVETEKVNIDVESFFTGVLRKILVEAGQTVPVGTPIALIGTPTEPLSEPSGSGGGITAASPAVAATNGATTVVTAPAFQTAEPVAAGSRVKSSPLARRIAEEHHIDLRTIFGTGPEGRIVKEDVEAAVAAAERHATTPATVAFAPTGEYAPAQMDSTATSQIVPSGDVDVIPLTNMRRTIARRLQQSMQTVPHFYVTMAMDASRLVDLRVQLNDALERQGDALRVSFNDLIVMAVSRNLARHPEINVSFDNDRILHHRRVNVGVAVALDSGLIVPVVRDADMRSVSDLAREIRRLVDAAHNNKLKPDEFQGGTFTISNLGMLDVESFTAIINPPEVAILAVGAIVPTPMVVDGQVVARPQIKMTMSSDHRAIDGAQAAYFMRDLKGLIEIPSTLLM